MDEININEDKKIIELDIPALPVVEEPLVSEAPSEFVEDNSEMNEDAIIDDDLTTDAYNLVLEEFDMEKREDEEWQTRTGLNPDTLCGAIETVIFMSDRPVPLIKIKNLIDMELPLRVLHSSINRLQEEYECKHHGLRLLEVAEGYQFRTKATYSKYVQDLFKVNSLVLTPSALEVLAILAYKQPVSKTEIEKIRGVDSSHIVRGLMDKRLVKMMGRSEEMGRPSLYGTTSEFLEVFNLSDLSQLPPEHELEELSRPSIGKIGDIKTICNGDKKQIFNLDELEELDRLSSDIKNISPETDFTHSLKLEEKKRNRSDGGPIKSVFELLEEHINSNLVKDNNILAAKSDPLGNIVDPKVICELELGPYNVPELEEEDDWQMIDLDTGEAIIEDELGENTETLEHAESEEVDLSGSSEKALEFLNDETELPSINDLQSEVIDDATEEFESLFSEEGVDEGESLAKALEDAFKNMQAPVTIQSDEIMGEAANSVNDSIEAIDTLTDRMSKDAEDMDIDLSFLNDKESSIQ